MTLFHKDEDFGAFLKVLKQGLERYPVRLLCYCLMGNHWHLVLRPRKSAALGELMRRQWLHLSVVTPFIAPNTGGRGLCRGTFSAGLRILRNRR
jgi:hypothetical protein